ncbi:hypothetical protein chiPu_0001689 [Chiloscyllium punctatum]|uniref:Uncharacterized protein n=1 Tax=Chiloscyllium punctatum TaxID=137246 RepID=A0A401RYR9_CHIPU|nr:hypothetical protein [Chiloscyllium punctatum]
MSGAVLERDSAARQLLQQRSEAATETQCNPGWSQWRLVMKDGDSRGLVLKLGWSPTVTIQALAPPPTVTIQALAPPPTVTIQASTPTPTLTIQALAPTPL